MGRSPKWGHILKGEKAFASIRGATRIRLPHGATLSLLPPMRGSRAVLGTVIPKRVGKAVRRNRLRRMIRAWAWERLPHLPPRRAVLRLSKDPGDGLGGLLADVEKAWIP